MDLLDESRRVVEVAGEEVYLDGRVFQTCASWSNAEQRARTLACLYRWLRTEVRLRRALTREEAVRYMLVKGPLGLRTGSSCQDALRVLGL